MKLGEMLLEAGLATEAEIEDAMSHDERRLGSALIAAGVVDADVVARTLAQQHGLPAINLATLVDRPAAIRALVPDVVARRHCAVAVAVRGTGAGRVLTVAMRDPADLVAVDELAFAAGMKIEPRVAPELSLRAALDAAPAAPAQGPITVAASGSGRSGSGAGSWPPGSATGSATASGSATGSGTDTGSGSATATASAGPLTYLPAGVPLTFQPSSASRMVSSVIKLGTPLVIVVLLVYLAFAYKKCVTPTTKPVGTHYDARRLGLSIDFPDAGWRISPGTGKKVDASAEYFYRGGVPELPHVGLLLLRGAPADISAAAQSLAADIVQDIRALECKTSYARRDAYMCRGMGAVGLFGQRMQNAEVEVHTWRGTTDLILAVMIKPDHTLSETEFVLSSITEVQ